MMKRRIATLALVLVGAAAFWWASAYLWSCPLLTLTGLPCPGCGMTRAIAALLRLDFAAAWRQNPMIYPLCLYALAGAISYLRDGGSLLRRSWYWISLAVLWVAVWVVRLAWGMLI